jgi:hypothetical protein
MWDSGQATATPDNGPNRNRTQEVNGSVAPLLHNIFKFDSVLATGTMRHEIADPHTCTRFVLAIRADCAEMGQLLPTPALRLPCKEPISAEVGRQSPMAR